MKRTILCFLMAGLVPAAMTRGEAELGLQLTPALTFVHVTGDKQKFREDGWLGNGFSGGIEEATLHRDLGKDTILDGTGRVFFDQHDYKLELALTKTDVGYVRAGFTQYRKFFDNTGGFFHSFSPAAFTLNRELGLDIGDVYFEAGLTLPKVPKIVFGYERQYKTGDKSLLEWGGVTQGGVTRNIFPAFENIDEHTDIFRLSIDHDIKTVHLGDEFRYERYANGTSRVDGALNLDAGGILQTATVTEDYHSDNFVNTFHMDSHVTEKLYWSLGYLFTTLDGAGSQGGSQFSPILGQPNATWLTRALATDSDSHVVNLNAMYGPIAHLIVSAGLQGEITDTHGFTDAALQSSVTPVTQTQDQFRSANHQENLDETLGVRYTKIPFTTLYADGKWSERRSTLTEGTVQDTVAAMALARDVTEFRQDYRIGFNTAPISRLTLAAHYRHFIDDHDYDNSVDTTAGYPGLITAQDFTTDETMLKLTLRPCARFSVSLMYQLVATDIRTGIGSPLITVPGGTQLSGNYDANIYSLSATLTPTARLYLTASGSFQDTRTVTLDNQNPALIAYKGNVYTLIGTAGYALDEKSDATLEYSYSAADNFTDNSGNGLPLGLTDHRHALLAGLSRQLRSNVIVRLRYGFYETDESSNGGSTNYRANLVSANCTIRF